VPWVRFGTSAWRHSRSKIAYGLKAEVKRDESMARIRGTPAGEQSKDEADHFILCPDCNGLSDCRDLGQALEPRRTFAASKAGPHELIRARTMPTKNRRWSIYRLRGTPAAYVGSVESRREGRDCRSH
jgi:hypothetical protein